MKLLLATDGSVYAQHAAQYVAGLCRRFNESSEIIAIYVKDVGSISVAIPMEPGAEAYFDVDQTRAAMDQSAAGALGAVEEALKGGNVTVRALAPWGRPADVICDTATAEGAELIVMGSSGMGQFTGILLGSVSDRVMHHAKQPVLVVRPTEG